MKAAEIFLLMRGTSVATHLNSSRLINEVWYAWEDGEDFVLHRITARKLAVMAKDIYEGS
jgi:hypothetical protein